ncbi:MAG: aminoacyl-tRNA hydrolase [Oscillospiraceae bacterium]|nr:aminoacyl-tRNA hydrolase [Oscillospiraceae bacterium]
MLFGRKTSAMDWILVFLGNPGPRYAMTRHNAGWLVADAVEAKFGTRINRLKFQALTGDVRMGDARVFLMKPQTFMNLSGDAVSQAQKFYHVPTEHILVVSDDVSLPVGKLRVRRSGSAGGHNGLKDIIAKCGGDGFPRVKVGVGSVPHPEYDMKDWVLGTFQNQDAEDILAAAKRAAEAVEAVITQGTDKAMNRYNA